MKHMVLRILFSISIMLIDQGGAGAAIQCFDCHGSRNPVEYSPLDAPGRDMLSGGFQGNHRNHASSASSSGVCEKCHPGSSGYATSHRDGAIKVAANINSSPLGALYRNATSAFPQTRNPNLGSCTNVNCHFEKTTPAWGSAGYSSPTDCNGACHGSPPNGGANGADGSHSAHGGSFAGLSGCSKCHPDHTAEPAPFSHATSANHRSIVVRPGNPLLDQQARYSGSSGRFLPSQTATYGYCSGTYCHNDGTSVATAVLPPRSSIRWGSGGANCKRCHGTPPAYANGSPKANSHPAHIAYPCNKCHVNTTADGATIMPGRYHLNRSYDVNAGAGSSFSYSYAPTGGTCSAISCHSGSATWGTSLSCDSCHECPPATASHVKHFGGTVAQSGYGDTRIAKDYSPAATSYLLNCGNCHPMDSAKHMNGIVEVELYDLQAPSGSLKKLNPASASYTAGATIYTDSRGFTFTNGTCRNVYCHSYTEWTTPGGVPASTTCESYWPPNLAVTTKYMDATWGGAPLGCSGCHGNPIRSSYPANDGGAGDSHSFISASGREYGHTSNMGYAALSCTYCHHDTVRQLNTYTKNENGIVTLSDAPIGNFSKHVNGVKDVAFDQTTSVYYKGFYSGKEFYMTFGNAAYNAETKTCTNVSCHIRQTSVKWGTPYRGNETYLTEKTECDRCHGFYGVCQ